MRNRGLQLFLYWIGCLIVTGILHTYWRYQTFSFVSFPLAIAAIITFTTRRPWRALVLVAIAFELFSHQIPGVMTVMSLIPLLFARIPKRPTSDLSISFFFYLLCIIFVQVLLLTAATSVAAGMSWQNFSWQTIPLPALSMIFTSAGAAIIAIMVWREWIEPIQEGKTIPRYKRLS